MDVSSDGENLKPRLEVRLSGMSASRLGRILFANGRAINFPILFAPMAGLSHVAFRQLVRSYLPRGANSLLFTEMLSTRLLPLEQVGHTPQTRISVEEDDLVPQLLGNDPFLIERSIQKLQSIHPGGLDINMG